MVQMTRIESGTAVTGTPMQPKTETDAGLLCFTAGTMIETPSGERAVERLRAGDMVWTADAGIQPIRWIHQRRISRAELRADETLRPILIGQHAFGRGTPERPLRVSPQHRVCISGWRAELFFGAPEVLVPACQLVNGDKITQPLPGEDVVYVHFLLDGHQIVRSNGLLSESFHPTKQAMGQMDAASFQEVVRIFPDVLDADGRFSQTARVVVKADAARLVY